MGYNRETVRGCNCNRFVVVRPLTSLMALAFLVEQELLIVSVFEFPFRTKRTQILEAQP